MEKLFDLTGEDPKDFSKLYRFQCDCLSPEDAMDISVDRVRENDKSFIICMSFRGSSFWDKLKYAFRIIRGNWNWRDFAIREEDCKNLSEIFDPNKKYTDLP